MATFIFIFIAPLIARSSGRGRARGYLFGMAAPSSAGFHDVAVIDAIEPSLWLALFDAYGDPPGLNRAAATTEHIAERLGVSGLPEPLQLAIEWIYNLGSADGCERLSAASREYNVDLSPWRNAAPIEFVTRAAISAASDANLRRALDRAQTGAIVASRPTSRVHEFRGSVAPPLPRPEESISELQRRLTPWLEGEGLGDRVDLSARREGAVTRFVVVRGKRLHAPVSFTTSGRRPLPHRPVQCDLLVYDGDANLLAIHAPSNLVDGYRSAAGEILFGEPGHFVPCECTLEPLKSGVAILNRHGSADVKSITLTYVKFRPNEGGTCEYSCGDAFALMSRLHVPLDEGEFVSARFQFAFYGKGRRSSTVEVQPPNAVKMPDDARSPIVLAALERMGMHRVDDGPARRYLWELSIGGHAPSDWRAVIPASGMDALIAHKVLVGRKRASVPHAAMPKAGRVLDVVDVDDDPAFFGHSVDERVPGRRLTSSEVEGLELDAPRLAALWATALRCAGHSRELPVNGLHDLGTVAFGTRQVQVLLALRAPGASLDRLTATLRGTGSVVVLVAPSRAPVTWPIPWVEISSPVPDAQGARRSIVRELSLEAEVDALDKAPPEASLVVDVPRKRAWLYEVALTLNEAPFTFVTVIALAKQQGRMLSKDELLTKLSGKDASENLARMTKKNAEKAIRSQLDAAGVPVPAQIFRAVNGSYEYVGHAFVAA